MKNPITLALSLLTAAGLSGWWLAQPGDEVADENKATSAQPGSVASATESRTQTITSPAQKGQPVDINNPTAAEMISIECFMEDGVVSDREKKLYLSRFVHLSEDRLAEAAEIRKLSNGTKEVETFINEATKVISLENNFTTYLAMQVENNAISVPDASNKLADFHQTVDIHIAQLRAVLFDPQKIIEDKMIAIDKLKFAPELTDPNIIQLLSSVISIPSSHKHPLAQTFSGDPVITR